MGGFLFEQIIFGPVKSRRLGISLGLNLLPTNEKHCTFNCLYCECGWTLPESKRKLNYPDADLIKTELEKKLSSFVEKNSFINTITFAGNGEPTIHPDFYQIMYDTIELRNKYFPDARIAVLSNGTMTGKKNIREALMMADINMLKIDAGTEETFRKLNNPLIDISLAEIINNYKKFDKKITIQTLFTRIEHDNTIIDNTTPYELDAWLNILKELKPDNVIIYPVARETPHDEVEKISPDILQNIAEKVKEAGFKVEIYN